MPTPKAPKTPLPKSLKVFLSVDDPRREHPTTLHKLSDIIGLTIMATLGGASNWVEIELWAKTQEPWLAAILELPHGIPSHDTISRVFALLDPGQMVQAFTQWTSELATHVKGVVALDGKTVRRSMSTADGRGPIHVVNAFAAESHLVLTQLKVEDKSNEIIALPKIIGMLDLTDCVATVDAMGCQVEVAKAVMDQHGDYMLQIKDNQLTLHDDVKKLYDWALDPSLPQDQRIAWVESESLNRGHGRLERRQCTGIEALDGLDSLKRWHRFFCWPEVSGGWNRQGPWVREPPSNIGITSAACLPQPRTTRPTPPAPSDATGLLKTKCTGFLTWRWMKTSIAVGWATAPRTCPLCGSSCSTCFG